LNRQRSSLWRPPLVAERAGVEPTSRFFNRLTRLIPHVLIVTLYSGWIVSLSSCQRVNHTPLDAGLFDQSSAIDLSDVALPHQIDLESVRTHPLDFLRHCVAHYDRTIKDYRCLFFVRERLGGTLGTTQEMDILFREEPFSVDVHWITGATGADRVNFVAGRWKRDDKELALIDPHGWLGLLAPGGVRRNIHAPDVLASSRRPIDQFGFRNTLKWFIHYSELASGDPRFDLRCVGGSRFDGHPCLVFERRLPYEGPGGAYPDRYQRMYLDAVWLIPRASFAYADDAGKQLLGSYVARDIHFNLGLTDKDFAPRTRPIE